MGPILANVNGNEVAIQFPGLSGDESGEHGEEVIPETAGEEAEKETSNPILPTTNELFWGAVTFLLLWALMKYVLLPPVVKTMEKRDAKVREDLANAEATRLQAEQRLSEYENSLASSKAEAVRIIEDARAKADADRKEVVAAAETDVAAQKAEAAQEVAAAKERAMAELRGSVAGIAIEAAEAVVQKQLDRNTEMQTIEDYVNRAGSQN